MKKWTLALAALALSSSAMAHRHNHNHGPFTGFYLGGNIGVVPTFVSHDSQTRFIQADGSEIAFSHSPEIGDNSFGAGLLLGFGFDVQKTFRVAVEGRANFEDNHLRNSFSSNFQDLLITTANVNAKLENDFAALLKLGMLLDTDCQLYGLIGADWGHFKVNANGAASLAGDDSFLSAALSGENHRYKAGLLVGLGLEYMVTPCTSIGLEYNYVDYDDIDFPGVLTGAVIDDTGSILPTSSFNLHNQFDVRVNRMTFNVNFYFG